MQPKRAEEFVGPWSEPAPAPARLADGDMAAGASPALLLREQLAQRLATPTGDVLAFEEPRLPVAARVVVIAGLASACWAAIWFAVSQII